MARALEFEPLISGGYSRVSIEIQTPALSPAIHDARIRNPQDPKSGLLLETLVMPKYEIEFQDKRKKPVVWLVDDILANRVRFEKYQDKQNDFVVKTFDRPGKVRKEIDEGQWPDALLCDIFFYPEGIADRVETDFDTFTVGEARS